jgi:hypothetical protein
MVSRDRVNFGVTANRDGNVESGFGGNGRSFSKKEDNILCFDILRFTFSLTFELIGEVCFLLPARPYCCTLMRAEEEAWSICGNTSPMGKGDIRI